jgi:ribosomal protein L44E
MLLAAMADGRRSAASKVDRRGHRSEQKGGGMPRFSVNGLTPTEVREHLDNDKCFHCHKVGHQSRDCRKKQREEGK